MGSAAGNESGHINQYRFKSGLDRTPDSKNICGHQRIIFVDPEATNARTFIMTARMTYNHVLLKRFLYYLLSSHRARFNNRWQRVKTLSSTWMSATRQMSASARYRASRRYMRWKWRKSSQRCGGSRYWRSSRPTMTRGERRLTWP